MTSDLELDAWTAAWQAAGSEPEGLRARVERQARFLRLMWMAEIAVTVVFGGGTLGWALVTRRPDVIVLAAGVIVFCTVAWVFAIRNRRGIWAPESLTTSAYLELSIVRAERRLQALGFSAALYAVMLAFNLAWIYLVRDETAGVWPFLISPSILVVWAITAALGVIALWHRRRVRAELEVLEAMRRQIQG